MFIKYLLIFLCYHYSYCVNNILTYDIPGNYVLSPQDYSYVDTIIVELWSGGAAGNIHGGGSGSYGNILINTQQATFNLIVGKGGQKCPYVKTYSEPLYSCENGSSTSITNDAINITLGGGQSAYRKLKSGIYYNGELYKYENNGLILSKWCNNCTILNIQNGTSGINSVCYGQCDDDIDPSNFYSHMCIPNTANGGNAPVGGKGGCFSYPGFNNECYNTYNDKYSKFYCFYTGPPPEDRFNYGYNGTDGQNPAGGGGGLFVSYDMGNVYPGSGGNGMIKIYTVMNCIPTSSIESSLIISSNTSYITTWYDMYTSLNINYDDDMNNNSINMILILLLIIIFCLILILLVSLILIKCCISDKLYHNQNKN